MARTLKVFEITTCWNDPRGRYLVAAQSKAEASRLLGCSVYHINNYSYQLEQTECEKYKLAMSQPKTVFKKVDNKSEFVSIDELKKAKEAPKPSKEIIEKCVKAVEDLRDAPNNNVDYLLEKRCKDLLEELAETHTTVTVRFEDLTNGEKDVWVHSALDKAYNKAVGLANWIYDTDKAENDEEKGLETEFCPHRMKEELDSMRRDFEELIPNILKGFQELAKTLNQQ
ncbi:hypothetical protein ACQKQC_18670 [Vibrio fortis]|uniref:hypothetical protein n=1 Tax=Vibrio fortis TaxID=212667 RepID=UPI00406945A5